MSYVHTLSLRALREAFEKGEGTRHARMLCRLARQGKRDLLSAMRDDVLGDDWTDFAFEGLQAHFRRTSGTVYVVSSPAHPGLVKVGKTRQSLEQRLKGLNNESVLEPFVVDASLRVADRHWVELQAHALLTQAGLHAQKEYFRVSADKALAAVQQAADADKRIFQSLGLYDLDFFHTCS